MAEVPRVSIIIPSYNADRYVREAVRSALVQTYPNFEVIVVDDGSTDRTRAILAPFVAAGKVRYFHQENKGLAGARNAGIRAATGKYIAFLDSDDVFLPDKIRRQAEALEAHPDHGACYSDIIHFTDTEPRRYFHHRYRYPSGDIFAPLLRRQFVNPLAVVLRRDLFDRYGYFDETMRRSEDWEFWLRIARAGVKFYYLDAPLAHYRMRAAGNLSDLKSEPQMKVKNLELFTRLGEGLSPAERRQYRFGAILETLRRKAAFAYLLVGDKHEALRYINRFSLLWWAIVCIPAALWRSALPLVRRVKHRLLLEPAGTRLNP